MTFFRWVPTRITHTLRCHHGLLSDSGVRLVHVRAARPGRGKVVVQGKTRGQRQDGAHCRPDPDGPPAPDRPDRSGHCPRQKVRRYNPALQPARNADPAGEPGGGRPLRLAGREETRPPGGRPTGPGGQCAPGRLHPIPAGRNHPERHPHQNRSGAGPDLCRIQRPGRRNGQKIPALPAETGPRHLPGGGDPAGRVGLG